MGLRGVGPDGEADGLAQLFLGGSGGPGTCQVSPRSVSVPRGQVGRQVAERRGLRVQNAFLVTPACDHLLFEHLISSLVV